MRLYIAGPMTGIEDYNFPEFNRVAGELAKQGHEIYNPATSFSGRQDLPYDMYLRHALQLVTMVEGIVLLEGWSNSRGALTEVHAGMSCVLPFYNYRDGELVEVEMAYSLLTLAMVDKYLADCDVSIKLREAVAV